jgi:hypothetical protein
MFYHRVPKSAVMIRVLVGLGRNIKSAALFEWNDFLVVCVNWMVTTFNYCWPKSVIKKFTVFILYTLHHEPLIIIVPLLPYFDHTWSTAYYSIKFNVLSLPFVSRFAYSGISAFRIIRFLHFQFCIFFLYNSPFSKIHLKISCYISASYKSIKILARNMLR